MVAVALVWALRSALAQGQEITEKFAHLTMTTSEHYREIRTREIDAVVAEADAKRTAAKVAEAASLRPDLLPGHTMRGDDSLQPVGWNG